MEEKAGRPRMLTPLQRWTSAAVICLAVGLPLVAAAGTTWIETFAGTPAQPQPFSSLNWDVQIYHSGRDDWYTPPAMNAQHGADCGAPSPVFALGGPGTHPIRVYEDQVFICKNHLMTAINAGYGEIILTPNQLLDWSAGPAVFQFSMSTQIASGRDWPDIIISPFFENATTPYEVGGEVWPRTGLQIREEGEWQLYRIQNFARSSLCFFCGSPHFNEQITPGTNQAATRQTFKLTLSSTRIKLERLASTTGAYLLHWDVPVSPALSFTQGVVQIGHHDYNPTKGCSDDGTCGPATWHWSDVSLTPAVPFTMIKATGQRYADPAHPTIRFDAPAPADAYLRFSGTGIIDVSYNGGATYARARRNTCRDTDVPLPHSGCVAANLASSYFTPIPAGTQTVNFRFSRDDWYGDQFIARDFSIWSTGAPAPALPPIPTPTPTVAPTAPPTVAPTAPPTVAPTAPPTADPTQPVVRTEPPTATDAPAATPNPMPVVTTDPPSAAASAPVPPAARGVAPVTVRSPAPRTPDPAAVAAAPTPSVMALANARVSVRPSDFHAGWLSQSAHTQLAPGATTALTVRFRNTGTASWLRGIPGQQANLGLTGDGAALAVDWPSSDRLAVQAEDVVPPGAVATFVFRVRAPSAPGTYKVVVRPVVDGTTWLEDEGVFLTVTSEPVRLDRAASTLVAAWLSDLGLLVSALAVLVLFVLTVVGWRAQRWLVSR
jgi:hypothetical protein